MPTKIWFFLANLWVGAAGLWVNVSLAADETLAPIEVTAPLTAEKSAGPLVPQNSVEPLAPRKSAKTAPKKSIPKNQSLNQKEYTLLPKVRIEAGGDTQSKGIPIEDLQPFFRFGLFMSKSCFLKLPKVTYAQDAHVLSADRDLIYSTKVEGNVGDTVFIYRMGKRYVEPKTKEFLGYMAFKSAEAQILQKQNTEKANNIVMQVKHNLEAIDKSMRITKPSWPPVLSLHYFKPALVKRSVDGYIIDLWDPGITLLGDNSAVVLSVGKREGVSVGDLLEIYRARDLLDSSIVKTKTKDRPEIRVGRVLVYQVDEKLSLGLITKVYEKIILFDKIRGEVLDDGDDECEAKNLDPHLFDDTCCVEEECLKGEAENKNLGDVLIKAFESKSD